MYWIDEETVVGGILHQVGFICDTDADIADLPTASAPGVKQGDDDASCMPVAKGSSCLVIGSSALYMLNSEDRWVEM